MSAGFWLPAQPLILASRSSARQHMLRASGIPFEAVPADIDEGALASKAGRDAIGVALDLARLKALKISADLPERHVLGADQTLECDGAIFSKPGSRTAAFEQIRTLSGKTHQLNSVAVLVRNDQVLGERTGVARITFRTLSDKAINYYLDIAGSSVELCVGAYQLEATGVHLFEKVEGDYWTILGLPLRQVCGLMRDLDLLAG